MGHTCGSLETSGLEKWVGINGYSSVPQSHRTFSLPFVHLRQPSPGSTQQRPGSG